MTRLDVFLTEKGFVATRSIAQNLIKMNKVTVNSLFPTKTGQLVSDADDIVVNNDINGSIGCYKLDEALNFFSLSTSVVDKICMDIGASNGGFTSVLLSHGAAKVYAVDVGKNMLPDILSQNSKVVIRDTTNAKDMAFSSIGEKVDIITIDTSFISLDKIINNMSQFLSRDGIIIALLKPQFEVGSQNLTKRGIVKSDKITQKVIARYTKYFLEIGYKLENICPVPKLFENKNTEFLLYIKFR